MDKTICIAYVVVAMEHDNSTHKIFPYPMTYAHSMQWIHAPVIVWGDIVVYFWNMIICQTNYLSLIETN